MIHRTITEKSKENIIEMSVFSKLFQSRILFIDDEINDELANGIICQLLYLNSLEEKEITIYINSPGGEVYAGLGIIDIMERIASPVKTIAIGKAMSMAAVVLISGDTRAITKRGTVMLHQTLGGMVGNFGAIQVNVKEMERVNNIIYDVIKAKTFITDPDTIFEKDVYYDAKDALKFGIIDEILE